MRILGIDYGEKKIGLSFSEGNLAAPIGVEPNTKDFGRKIKDFCQKEKVEKIVLGISEGQMAQKQKKFGAKMARICGLPVELWDETLTSQEAVKVMIESGRKRKKRRVEDAVSAALILQSYLDFQKEAA